MEAACTSDGRSGGDGSAARISGCRPAPLIATSRQPTSPPDSALTACTAAWSAAGLETPGHDRDGRWLQYIRQQYVEASLGEKQRSSLSSALLSTPCLPHLFEIMAPQGFSRPLQTLEKFSSRSEAHESCTTEQFAWRCISGLTVPRSSGLVSMITCARRP